MKEVIDIRMPYIGSVLSVNSCWIRGRGGVRTNALKPETRAWMLELEEKSTQYKGLLTTPVNIRISACFKDSRHPDMDNLFKVLCDGLKKGLGIDDKFFNVSTGEVRIDSELPPQLVMEIWDSTYPNPNNERGF